MKVLPPQTGFLTAALKYLQSHFNTSVDKKDDVEDDYEDDFPRKLGVYPVLPWKELAGIIRAQVNPLASEEHLRELIQQLQLQGDVRIV